ncbi:hypothetical protein BV898_03949 [Hypsibius exemplaris]|uniref:Uncharacterized protein n=1 Tax=Hypsibius exemplaris TaxID=2072580 RepID=A0A1W0X455_HYPEX|nr:hypothetical protein BV898_03949 [Hypsibius exemplaris]
MQRNNPEKNIFGNVLTSHRAANSLEYFLDSFHHLEHTEILSPSTCDRIFPVATTTKHHGVPLSKVRTKRPVIPSQVDPKRSSKHKLQ